MPDPFATLELEDVAGPEPVEEPGSSYWMLWLAAVSLALSIVTFVDDSRGIQLIGYALAAPIPFCFVALFRRASTARLLSAGIGIPSWVSRAGLAVLFVGLVLSVLHALVFSSHFA